MGYFSLRPVGVSERGPPVFILFRDIYGDACKEVSDFDGSIRS